MEEIYTKLAIIKYNEKIFQIFKTKSNKKVFLEIVENKEYCYPSLSDNKFLNKLYNGKNRNISYASKNKFKGLIMGSSLTALACLTVVGTGKYIKILNEKEEVVMTIDTEQLFDNLNSKKEKIETVSAITVDEEEIEEFTEIENYILVNDTKHLDSLLGIETPITYDDVYKALNDNTNMILDDKVYVMMYLNNLKEKFPNINLTCLYYNIKDLSIVYDTEEEIEARSSSAGAYFDHNTKQVHFMENYYDYEDPIAAKHYFFNHEFTHMLNKVRIEKNGKIIVRSFDDYATLRGSKIDEGFVDYIVSQILDPDSSLSYPEEASVVSGLLNNLNGYSLDDYFEKNIYYLMSKMPIDNPTYFVDLLDVLGEAGSTVELVEGSYDDIYNSMIDIYYINRYDNASNDEYTKFINSIKGDRINLSAYEDNMKNTFYGKIIESRSKLLTSQAFNIVGYSEIINNCSYNNVLYHVYINDLNQVYFGPYLITDAKCLYDKEELSDMTLLANINGSSYLNDCIRNSSDTNLDYNDIICNQDLLVQYYQDTLLELVNGDDSKTLVK